MNKGKSILVIHHGCGVGGGLVALLGVIEELKQNYQVQVLSVFDSIAVDYLRKAGVPVYLPRSRFYLKFYGLLVHSAAGYFNLMDGIRGIQSLLCFLLSKHCFAKKELEKLPFDYDLVYLNSTFISDWSPAAKRLNKKVIIHVREPLSKGLLGLRKSLIRSTINAYCDQIIAITRDNAVRVGIPDKTTVIYDPVVTEGRDGFNEIETGGPCKYFVYLGGMIRIKGFEQLVESLDFLAENVRILFLGPEVHYHEAGVKAAVRGLLDPYPRRHKLLIQKMRASDKIVYIGQTDNVFAYLKKSMALISPFSRPHAALPVLEAFSLGLPVIVSDVQGADELLDGQNGFVFRNNDPQALAAAINKMAALTDAEYRQMSAAGRETFRRIRTMKDTVTTVVESI